jgi:hypothetical protein
MRIRIRSLAPLAVASAVGIGFAVAPVAAAAPQCVNTSPTTTQCENPGNAQITTTPPFNSSFYPWFGWPFGGGLVIGLGW